MLYMMRSCCYLHIQYLRDWVKVAHHWTENAVASIFIGKYLDPYTSGWYINEGPSTSPLPQGIWYLQNATDGRGGILNQQKPDRCICSSVHVVFYTGETFMSCFCPKSLAIPEPWQRYNMHFSGDFIFSMKYFYIRISYTSIRRVLCVS
jgi:hypothetical protein